MTNDKQRERLVELIRSGINKHESTIENYVFPLWEYVADYLLANGVIVPPVKIKTKVYKIFQGKIYEYEVASYTVDADGFSFIHLAYMEGNTIYGATHSIEEFNKQYYFTKEEAEQALVTDTNVGSKKEEGAER